jgi:hypothetical protein
MSLDFSSFIVHVGNTTFLIKNEGNGSCVCVCAQALRDETTHDAPTTSEEEKEEEEIEEDEGRCSDELKHLMLQLTA